MLTALRDDRFEALERAEAGRTRSRGKLTVELEQAQAGGLRHSLKPIG